MDIALTLLLGVQMAYSLVGEVSHEITGLCMIALLALHHALNGGFHRRLFRGKYTPYRIALTAIDGVMLVIFLLQGISGLMMAKHIRILNVNGASRARTVHLLGAYWGFALCGVHAGLHMTGLMRRWIKIEDCGKKAVVGIAALAVVVCGILAFIRRDLPGYMTLRRQFVFFDYSEPLALFFLDYALVLLMLMALGCVAGCGLQNIRRRKHP